MHPPDAHAESGSDSIEIEGIEKFCADLKVDPTDQIVLLIAWQMNAETMGVFTRDEWTGGMMAMGVEDIPQLIAAFPTLRQLLNSDGNFQDFYTFCFRFSKDPGHGVRTLREWHPQMTRLLTPPHAAAPFEGQPPSTHVSFTLALALTKVSSFEALVLNAFHDLHASMVTPELEEPVDRMTP